MLKSSSTIITQHINETFISVLSSKALKLPSHTYNPPTTETAKIFTERWLLKFLLLHKTFE